MLAEQLKILLGSTFVYYTKIHGFHFNVEGDNFPQYHEFLNTFYAETYATIDTIGEYIRSLDSYTPGNLSRMLELSIIEEQPRIPRSELMFAELLTDATKMIDLARSIFELATQSKEQGIANYMADLQDMYSKKAWMMRSVLKKDRG